MGGARLVRPIDLSDATAALLEQYTLRRDQPLPLFAALAHSATALEDLVEGSKAAIERTVLPTRLREVLIMRTLAQWGARAEWDVHALIYAPLAPLTAAELARLGGSAQPVAWNEAERLMIDVADHLRRTARLPANLWAALAHAFSQAECAEIVMVAAQYVKVALMTNALDLPSLVPDGPPITIGAA